MPKLEESHKEILFTNWDSQLREVKKATEDVAGVANSVIKNINENLHSANLVLESIPSFLPNVKQLELHWKQATEEKSEAIRQRPS